MGARPQRPVHRWYGPRRRHRRALLALLLALLGTPAGATGAGADPAVRRSGPTGSDAREVAVARAVGRLLVPAVRYEQGYARHYDEQCTASVISVAGGPSSRYLLSAWHCLEDYRDLSRPLLFETADGERYPVRLLVSGGGMDRDWALLGLREELSGALAVAPDVATPTAPVALAGYPRGKDLTVLRHCAISGSDGRDTRTSCVMQRGASGGAVLSHEERPRIVGVISRGDGVSQSIFVPVASFYPRIRAHLAGAR